MCFAGVSALLNVIIPSRIPSVLRDPSETDILKVLQSLNGSNLFRRENIAPREHFEKKKERRERERERQNIQEK